MPEIEFQGKTFKVDEDGFIDDYNNWCEEWVQYVKEKEGIEELTDDHNKVMEVLREYFSKNGIAPLVRVLSKVTGFKLQYIYELFPSGPRARVPVEWRACLDPLAAFRNQSTKGVD